MDYYSDCDTIIGNSIVYKVFHDKHFVMIENITNKMSHEPIIWTDTGEKAYAETRPSAKMDVKTVRKILRKVFTKKEIKQFNKSNDIAEIGVVIDPQTGKSLEVQFVLSNYEENDCPRMYSIPIQNIEQLEILIKQNLYWKITPLSEKASHIEFSFRMF